MAGFSENLRHSFTLGEIDLAARSIEISAVVCRRVPRRGGRATSRTRAATARDIAKLTVSVRT